MIFDGGIFLDFRIMVSSDDHWEGKIPKILNLDGSYWR